MSTFKFKFVPIGPFADTLSKTRVIAKVFAGDVSCGGRDIVLPGSFPVSVEFDVPESDEYRLLLIRRGIDASAKETFDRRFTDPIEFAKSTDMGIVGMEVETFSVTEVSEDVTEPVQVQETESSVESHEESAVAPESTEAVVESGDQSQV